LGRRGDGGGRKSKLLPGDKVKFAGVLGERVAELKLGLGASSKSFFIKRGESCAIV
jgi:hypothetical protein